MFKLSFSNCLVKRCFKDINLYADISVCFKVPQKKKYLCKFWASRRRNLHTDRIFTTVIAKLPIKTI